MDNYILIKPLIELALKEDLAFGDVTSSSSIDDNVTVLAYLVAKQDLIFCGGPIIKYVRELVGYDFAFQIFIDEGEPCVNGTKLVEFSGLARELLAVERVLLNFLQRLSGVATTTAEFVKQAGNLKILDTRKTTPGWRVLEKYAVRVGGGDNHRMSMGDMILVKDNHFDANQGDVDGTLTKVFDRKATYMPVEVEVRSVEELEQVLKFPVNVVMLDNMNAEQLKQCVELIRLKDQKIMIEASGGISIDQVSSYQDLGLDAISTSSITAGAMPVDISMDVLYKN